MTAERIDLSALRVGDKVTITFEVVNQGLGHVYFRHLENCTVVAHANTYHGTVERAPRPLEVGDRVKRPIWCGYAKIKAISDGVALLKFQHGGWGHALLSDLTREACHD